MEPLKTTRDWFTIAKPEPTDKDRMVQLGVHLEEVSELLDVLSTQNTKAAITVIEAIRTLRDLANDVKANPNDYYIDSEDRVEALDALCDQIVTATGTAHFLGMDILGAMGEVNASNHSKFVDGKAVLTEQGKIAKGPDFFRPDLTPFA